MYKGSKACWNSEQRKDHQGNLSDFSAADPSDSQVSKSPCLPVGVKIELAIETPLIVE